MQGQRVQCLPSSIAAVASQPDEGGRPPAVPQGPANLAAEEEPASFMCGQKPCLGCSQGTPESGTEGVCRSLGGQPCDVLSLEKGSRSEPLPPLPPAELDFHSRWRGVSGAK